MIGRQLYPALSDVLPCEHRLDHNNPFPATLIAANGSLICCGDYEMCTALAKEIVAVRT